MKISFFSIVNWCHNIVWERTLNLLILGELMFWSLNGANDPVLT
uniref:Uncharacterized protein n=1 Tax=Arundo donax TaxID=35708 RepID=A0A0A9G0L0_ARUDO